MPLPTPAFHAWSDAEKAAEAAERQLYDLVMLPETCSDPQSLDARAAAAKVLRKRAHELFGAAMQEMKAMAESQDCRRILGPTTVAGACAPPSPVADATEVGET